MSEPTRCSLCGRPLDSPGPGGLCPYCLVKMGLDAAAKTRSTGAEAAEMPDVIGPYHLLQALGEGGMGRVYLAEQREPLVRRVALKLIKPGMDTREVLARFEAERHALALMDHPNIARVLDAGLGPHERPFFVMEYVAGVPVTDYCDRHRLRIADRLQIFLQVCAALQHAHQKGIIHRDLKPSNILVTVQDGKPVPKVIDFGIAKATRQGNVAHAAFTRLGILIGTPEYMSPEQAEAGGLEVDTTTDIYSLGVVLYELMTGVLPFDGEALRQAGYAEMQRIIREQDPPKPSLRFTALGATGAEVARQHQATQPALGKQLQGDLDAIAMKALEKDRTRRYASASEFASDITRYLNGEPVVASPPSVMYLTRKFVKRHRLGVAAAALVVAALVVGLTVSTVFFMRSEAARAQAETEAARNRLDADAMMAALREDGDAYRSLSEQAMALHRRALGADNPALAPHLVNRLLLLDLVFGGHWVTEDYASVREAIGLIERALDAGDMSAVRTLLLLSDAGLGAEGDLPRLFRKAFELVRRAPNGDRATSEQLNLLADLLENEPTETTPNDDGESAERIARDILELRQRSNPAGGEKVTSSRLRLAGLLVARAERFWKRGDFPSAARTYREALSLVRGAGPGSEYRVAEIETGLGRCLIAPASLAEAEQLLTRSYRVFQTEKGERYATTQLALNRLVDLYTAWAKPEQANRYRAMLPAVSIREVRDLGRVRFIPQVLARFDGVSASIGGRSVWVFRDTTTLGFAEGRRRRIDSSWGVLDPPTNTDVLTVRGPTDGAGTPIDLIPRTAQETDETWRLQSKAVVWDSARDRALVFYTKKETLKRRPVESRRVGTSLALWPRPDGPAVRPLVRPEAEDPTLLFGEAEPPWGSAALTDGDWLYTYACEPNKSLGMPCLLARVPLNRVFDRTEWRFYARGRWSSDWRAATPVIDGFFQMSVARNDYLGKYVAVSTHSLSTLIGIRTADRPEGPWSEEIVIEGLPPAAGLQWNGSSVGHPELARGGGRAEILTYTRDVGIAANETRAVEIEFRKR